MWVVISHNSLAAPSVHRTEGAAEGKLSQNTTFDCLEVLDRKHIKRAAEVCTCVLEMTVCPTSLLPNTRVVVLARVESILRRLHIANHRHYPHRRCRTQYGCRVFRPGTMPMRQWIEGSAAWKDSFRALPAWWPSRSKDKQRALFDDQFQHVSKLDS